jgi:hypothetical protein
VKLRTVALIRAPKTTHFKRIDLRSSLYHHGDARQKIAASKSKIEPINQLSSINSAIYHISTQILITILFVTFTFTMMFKSLLVTALAASASAFAPAGVGKFNPSLALFKSSCHSNLNSESDTGIGPCCLGCLGSIPGSFRCRPKTSIDVRASLCISVISLLSFCRSKSLS